MFLGKASSSTSCYLCGLAATKWKPVGHEKGSPCMLEQLIGTSQQLTKEWPIVDGIKHLPLITTLFFAANNTYHVACGK